MYTHISQVPPRRQWEPSSAPNKPVNCGPTSASFVADFYRDATFGIEETRDLVHPANGDGTSGGEQALMLTRRGVSATVQQPTAVQLTALVANGDRPVIIGMLMSVVPAAIRGHSFPGVHAVVVRQNAVVNGVPGKLIMDPNFGYGQTVDTTNGARFYPDSVVEAARSGAGANRNAVVPTNPKAGANVTTLVDAVKFLGPDGKPAPRSIGFAGGVTFTGYALDGTTKPWKAGAGGSSAPSDARCTITQSDNKAPKGSGWIRITAGVFADHPYLVEAQPGLTVPPDPPMGGGGGVPPADVAKAVAEAKAAGKAEGLAEGAASRDQAWEAKIAASHHP